MIDRNACARAWPARASCRAQSQPASQRFVHVVGWRQQDDDDDDGGDDDEFSLLDICPMHYVSAPGTLACTNRI